MKLVVVTGASSGIGYAICDALLSKNYSVIGIGRSEENCKSAEQRLHAAHENADIRFLCADLMQQNEVIKVAEEIVHITNENYSGKLYALVNNAGCVRSRFMTTGEGYEQQFALNYLAGFLLTHALMPLIKSANAAVIFTGSSSHKMMKVNWKDIMYARWYRPLCAYKQSKLCNMLLVSKLRDMGIRACAVDPGLVNTSIGNKDTDGIVNLVWQLRRRHGLPPQVTAQTYLSLCENGFTEIYYGHGMKLLRISTQVNAKNADRLYELSLHLCGMKGEGNA